MSGEGKSLRSTLRARFFRFLRLALTHDDGREAMHTGGRDLFARRTSALACGDDAEVPYPEIADRAGPPATCDRDDIVFLTARFRSGSTLLWNLFRHVDGVTAYYEPFNERRWFDPARRGDRVDPTHRGIRDYWREYDGLDARAVPFEDEWATRRLHMDAEAWAPAMKRYLEVLVEHARRRPVLAFNRVDFRLPWLRRSFPNARIVHLVRQPRDQWCSSLPALDAFGPSGGALRDFGPHDGFYLLAWVRDLRFTFPFLAEHDASHPYRHFYWLWKLSYLYARKFADVSIRFEDLIDRPREVMAALAERLELFELGRVDGERTAALIEKPEIGKWRRYASEAWFAEHEDACEAVLRDFFRTLPDGSAERGGTAEPLRAVSAAGSVAPRRRSPSG